MTMPAPAEAVLATLRIACFERVAPERIQLATTPPDWLTAWGQPVVGTDMATVFGGEVPAFLEHLAMEAETTWDDPAISDGHWSGAWEEVTPDGRTLFLDARAVSLAGRDLLLVEALGQRFSQQRDQLQQAREGMLAMERLQLAQQDLDRLYHIFYHDIFNTIGALRGWTSLLNLPGMLDAVPESTVEAIASIARLGERLDQDLEQQRLIHQAETESYRTHPELVSVDGILEDVQERFAHDELAMHRNLVIEDTMAEDPVRTDRSILDRVLENLVRNALEATPEDGTVRVWADQDETTTTVFVHNDGVIPEEIARHVFDRSFSTKARHGRGWGTYAARLLTERLLGGRVFFESEHPVGTVFRVELPLAPGAAS